MYSSETDVLINECRFDRKNNTPNDNYSDKKIIQLDDLPIFSRMRFNGNCRIFLPR